MSTALRQGLFGMGSFTLDDAPAEQFNTEHDDLGRFASGGGSGGRAPRRGRGAPKGKQEVRGTPAALDADGFVPAHTTVDAAKGREVGQLVGAKNQECYRNGVLGVASMGAPGYRYVEGYATPGDFPMVVAHGWIEGPNGEIVDPTPVWHVKPGATYFPAVRYTSSQVYRAITRDGMTPINHGLRKGVISPEFEPAYKSAWRSMVGDVGLLQMGLGPGGRGHVASHYAAQGAMDAYTDQKAWLVETLGPDVAAELMADVTPEQMAGLVSYPEAVSPEELRQFASNFNPNHDDRGRFADTDGSGGAQLDAETIAQPGATYPPANPDGIDTKQRFMLPNGQYTTERQELHDALVRQRFAGKEPNPGPVRTVTVMGGGPASGKSVLLQNENLGLDGAVHADPDSFKQQLPEFQELVAAGDLRAGSYAHEESSDLAKQTMHEAVTGGYDAVLDGTGDNSYASLQSKVTGYRMVGHRVVGHYVSCDTETAVARAFARGQKDGRFVPEDYLRMTHKNVSNVVQHAISTGLFDELTVWDTNSPKAVRVATARGRQLTIHNQAAWDRFVAKGRE